MRGSAVMTYVFGGAFVLLFLFTLNGARRPFRAWLEKPRVSSEVLVPSDASTLFLIVHGFGGGQQWAELAAALRERGAGAVVGLRYAPLSSADPLEVTRRLAAEAARHYDAARHDRVVLIGVSMGALLARRMFLDAHERGAPWAEAIDRIVLVAGMNRGWDITGHKPADLGALRYLQLWLGSWFSRLTEIASLPVEMEAGSPFVANLRLDWMHALRTEQLAKLEVVQLLGDIDDLVSDQDNKDLAAFGAARFVWLRVRGTGHGDAWYFTDDREEGGLSLGEYRKRKFLAAATATFEDLQLDNERDPFATDEDVTHVVFVIHGIRDLGQWAAAFELQLKEQFESVQLAKKKLVVASLRYGYFGMGPFLLLSKRQNYVRWLMDEYTEILARYPKVEQIHFVGHSNGTYLLASALERYTSLKVNRVVFGGSVVRADYDWARVLERGQVDEVRNYVAADDWIVALFPRFFEPAWSRGIFANDLGSAGFQGFHAPSVTNIAYLTGGHGAFLEKDRTAEIARYLIHGDGTPKAPDAKQQSTLWKLGWAFGTWLVVWPLLALAIVWTGWHVVMSATEPRWPMALGYLLLLTLILRSA